MIVLFAVGLLMGTLEAGEELNELARRPSLRRVGFISQVRSSQVITLWRTPQGDTHTHAVRGITEGNLIYAATGWFEITEPEELDQLREKVRDLLNKGILKLKVFKHRELGGGETLIGQLDGVARYIESRMPETDAICVKERFFSFSRLKR